MAASGAILLENASAELSAALARQAAGRTAESEVRLAQAFMRHGVLDKASEHFAEASRRDPREGAAWDGLARVWRDWGFPDLGLGDAYRAVYASPDSPAMRNTLGTVLLALGRGADARAQFARAAALDPGAAYAWNNLCYAWLAEGDFEPAIADCSRALAIDPGFGPAARNLAFARMLADRAPADGQAGPGKGGDHERR
jgi:Tfp pilus assembly protein PilF